MLVTKMTKVLVGLILFCSFTTYAQEVPEAEVETPLTLEQQFRQMIDKTETFKEYKVIKITSLNDFWKTVEDSINKKENAIAEAEQKIAEQQNEISGLNTTIREGQASIDEAAYDREHINVLGIDLQKSAFIWISFIIIAALIVTIIIGYSKYRYSTRLAADKSRSYDKLEEEYKNYQDKSREKQMKLKRDLQTQVNKIEELKHKNISFK